MQAERQRQTVGHTVNAPLRTRGLRSPWRPGESGNPKGRPSHRKLFEEALARAVTANAEALVATLVKMALEGDARMMTALLDRLVPRMQRHELHAADAPTSMVIRFEKPEREALALPSAKRE